MLTNKKIKFFSALSWLVSIAIASILVFTAICTDSTFIIINKDNIIGAATLLGTFDFTMTGFIAAVGAYLISITRKVSFLKWSQEGYVSIFYNLYAQSIVFLLLSFIACMLSIITAENISSLLLKCAIFISPLNMSHILVLTIIALQQMKK